MRDEIRIVGCAIGRSRSPQAQDSSVNGRLPRVGHASRRPLCGDERAARVRRVDAAALFISIIGALGMGAAAIMAWTSRADALRAEAEARNAEAAALKTANDSADALREANRIAREQFGELREAERRRERARWAAKLRRWMTVKIAKAQTGSSRPPFASDPTFADLSALRA